MPQVVKSIKLAKLDKPYNSIYEALSCESLKPQRYKGGRGNRSSRME